MKLKTFFLSLVGIIALSTGFSSCNSDSDDGTQLYAVIATYQSSSDLGSTFTYRKEGDEPLITLTTSQKFSSEIFKVGSRVLIQYTTDLPAYTSGAIQVIGMANTVGGGANATEATAAETENWKTDIIEIRSLWRTGSYLDIAFIASVGANSYFKFYLDKATIGTSCPEFHIVLTQGGSLGGQQGLYYASYSIANAWDNPATDEIKIVLPDKTITTIKKNTTVQPITPAE